MVRPLKTFVEKPAIPLRRFQKAVRQILAVPKKEIDKREAEYQRTKKTARNKGDNELVYWTY